MIRNIIRFSASHKYLVLAITLGLVGFAYHSMTKIRLDALPDLSDTQVIVYSKWERSPDIMEDQVTYPIITALLGAPRVKSIRGYSDFGYSFVYVIFEDSTDIYWARARVLEYLSKIGSSLPDGVSTEIGPDASGVGWIYQYVILDEEGNFTVDEMRTLQDFRIKYLLNSIPGVAEVASVGGQKKQYQIQIDPSKLLAFDVSLTDVIQKVKDSNNEVGARLLETSGTEYMIRVRGYLESLKDIESIVISADQRGNPLYLRNIAHITEGPDLRRGVTDYNGRGDTVGGIVVMRTGENALEVIRAVEKKIEALEKTLPAGVKIVPVYNRKELIEGTIQNLRNKLIQEMIIVALIIFIFLWHFPSAIVPILTIPISVLIMFIPLYLFDIDSNLMSLSGIAISIGVLVDGAIVEVENAYKKMEEWNTGGRKGDYHQIRLEALTEVGPSVFFSLLIVSVSFLPIFALVDQEGRLFRPLAFTKNLTMFIAAFLAISLDPALRMFFARMDPFQGKWKFLNLLGNKVFIGKYYPEEKHPISSRLLKLYSPICKYTLDHPYRVILGSILLVLSTIPIGLRLGSEFMPPFYEGSLLYMPTTMPGISVAESERILADQGKRLKEFPEIRSAFGKAGRADTSTDPSPLSMFETTILLHPQDQWRPGMTREKLMEELDKAMSYPGLSNAWTMPIRARIDMLSTGMRTPIGIKVQGEDLKTIEGTALEIEKTLRGQDGVRNIFAERIAGGYYLDIEPDRVRMARYGVSISDVQSVILSAVGGKEITETVEGRERYSVNIRYPRELRDSPEKIGRILLPTAQGGHIPLREVAEIRYTTGASMIRNENGFLTAYVFIDTDKSDLEGFVSKLENVLDNHIKIPPGISLEWSGQYENILRARERLTWVIPITLSFILFLLFANTGSWKKTWIVFTAVPFSLIGAFWILYFLDYQMSVAVWVGMIALLGLDAETGMFMLLYIDLAVQKAKKTGIPLNTEEFKTAIHEGSVQRIRPKLMTVLCGIFGLLPILWSDGPGSDMMQRIAAPMVGGLITSFLLELAIYPPLVLLFLDPNRE
jgi:Cu(I)/Ag(I) efflux system membrane protein CusA/SilA